MRFHSSIAALAGAFYSHQVVAFPGMDRNLLSDLMSRQASGFPGSTALIGDLITLPDSQLTTTGAAIKAILTGKAVPTDTSSTYTPPSGGKSSAACAADPCCIWSYIASDMKAAFVSGGQCTALARGAVRLGFHDAATWSTSSSFGGADGSILLSNELSRSDNNGLQAIGAQTKTWYNTYHSFGVSMADLIQFGTKVATRLCPGGPRIRTFVGRVDNATPNPTGLLPDVNSDAPALIALFAAKTFVSNGLVALVGAHTVSQQFFVNTTLAGQSQDTTPGIWDLNFYSQTKASTTPSGVFKFHSDVSLSAYSGTTSTWQLFTTAQGAALWPFAFAQEYIRMSLLGVNRINSLTECTKVLPP